MFPWELVLQLVGGIVTQHSAASKSAQQLADEHAAAAKAASEVHADVTALHESAPLHDTPDEARLKKENETLKRAMQLMMVARQMFPNAVHLP